MLQLAQLHMKENDESIRGVSYRFHLFFFGGGVVWYCCVLQSQQRFVFLF